MIIIIPSFSSHPHSSLIPFFSCFRVHNVAPFVTPASDWNIISEIASKQTILKNSLCPSLPQNSVHLPPWSPAQILDQIDFVIPG